MIDVSPRIQRITIQAWQYNFEPQHIPGRNNVISDTLSMVTPLEFQDSNADKDILAVNFLQYSSLKEREKGRGASRNQQRSRTPGIKACDFYRLANKEKPDSSILIGILEMNS